MGADSLLDHIQMMVGQNPDFLNVVLKLMENNEYLCHIAKKIRGEIEGENIILYWIHYNQLYMWQWKENELLKNFGKILVFKYCTGTQLHPGSTPCR